MSRTITKDERKGIAVARLGSRNDHLIKEKGSGKHFSSSNDAASADENIWSRPSPPSIFRFHGPSLCLFLFLFLEPLHYEIVVNVFRTRPRHLVKFQSSRPIVVVRADSANYRPIKPPLRIPYRPSWCSRSSAAPSLPPLRPPPNLPLAFRPPLFPAHAVHQITNTARRERER